MDDVHSPKIRVLTADDHPLVRKGISAILANEADVELVAEASDGQSAVDLFRRYQPDVTLMDLRMPVLDGIGAVKQICSEFPAAKIIALTSFDGDQDVFRALEAGVRGYLLKEMVHTSVLSAVRTVAAGQELLAPEVAARIAGYFPKNALTTREVEVLKLVSRGLANKEIAAQLGMAAGTVKIHVQNVLKKLEAVDRTQAVTIALKRGIIDLN